GERGGQQGLQRLDELAGGGGVAPAERGEEVVVQVAHGGDGPPGDLGAGVGDRQLHGPAVGGVGGALDQAVALEGAGQLGGGGGGALDQAVALEGADQLGDVEGFEAGVVGELALGGAAAGPAHAVERGEHRVLGVGQPVGGDGPVDGGPPPGGEAPDEVAGGGGLGQRGHGQTLYMATMSMATVFRARRSPRRAGPDGGRSGAPAPPGLPGPGSAQPDDPQHVGGRLGVAGVAADDDDDVAGAGHAGVHGLLGAEPDHLVGGRPVGAL